MSLMYIFSGYGDPSGAAAAPVVRPDRHTSVTCQVQAGDPSFSPDPFLADFKKAFIAIQEAWMAQDMTSVRHCVSDGIDEKFAVQFREQQRRGYREELSKIRVRQARLARFDASGPFEVLTVQVSAILLERRVPLKSDSGDPDHWANRLKELATTQIELVGSQASSFREYWSLVRRRGTQTRQDGGRLLAGSCPNCGSPLQLNRLGSCQTCGSLVRSGVYDWVLSEITQYSQWRTDVPAELAARVGGYLRQFDSGFSRQHMEDRAWVIMSRLSLADTLRDLSPLRKVALPKFTDRYELPPSSSGTPSRINGLDLIGFVVEDEKHFALLRVHRWPEGEGLLVLFRQAGVVSNQETALQSAHCPSCGAPEETQATDACASCEQVTNTGKYGWVLRDFIEDATSLHARVWRRRVTPAVVEPAATDRTSLRPADCVRWALAHLVREGGLSETERNVLGRCASSNRIATADFAQWIVDAETETLEVPQAADKRVCQQWWRQLVGLARHDGRIDKDARGLLTRLAEVHDLTDCDVGLTANKQSYGNMVV